MNEVDQRYEDTLKDLEEFASRLERFIRLQQVILNHYRARDIQSTLKILAARSESLSENSTIDDQSHSGADTVLAKAV